MMRFEAIGLPRSSDIAREKGLCKLASSSKQKSLEGQVATASRRSFVGPWQSIAVIEDGKGQDDQVE